jgi:uncharacterized membrane protein YkoI
MHAHHIFTTIALILLSLAASTAAPAQEFVEWWPRQQYQVRSGMSLDEAVQMAQSRFNARVVKAETVRSGNRRIHQIRLLAESSEKRKVFTVRVDAETGQMF